MATDFGAGYGFIYAVEAAPSEASKIHHGLLEADGRVRLVLKVISAPQNKTDEGHLRKVFSYEVEQYFYEEIAPLLSPDVAVAKCVVSTRHQGLTRADNPHGVNATLITDLRGKYPVCGEKRSSLSPDQTHSSLRWLAKFHGSSWDIRNKKAMAGFLLPPLEESEARNRGKRLEDSSIWLNGGYTYLATRRTEYASLASDPDSEWGAAFCRPRGTLSMAEKAAQFLTPVGRAFETFIHGDVKSENLFATASGDGVAFFDFQYVGLGLGVSDLAKFFTCSVPLYMLIGEEESHGFELPMQKGELDLLQEYHQTLLGQDVVNHPQYDFVDFCRHWETALVDWCRFQASWGFWGNTTWLQSRVRHILRDRDWHKWLDQQL